MLNNKAYSTLLGTHVTRYALLITIMFVACKREKPVIPDPIAPTQCWTKFVGNYIVYDTINDTSWVMTIGHELDTNQADFVTDFLTITNFYHQFDLHYQFTCCSIDTTWTEYTCLSYDMHPCTNYSNNRYNIHDYSDDLATMLIENRLNNDTIVLYFRMENTAYWMSDAVFYEDAYHKHIAVKQH